MRGEFIRGDGLVIPNNVTQYGASLILVAAFQGTPTPVYLGLCSGVFASVLHDTDVNEPTFTNGYMRVSMPLNSSHWNIGSLNGEAYAESVPTIFTAAGGNFSKPITRCMLLDGTAAGGTSIMALSTPMQDPLLITPATDAALRTFKYRFYLR